MFAKIRALLDFKPSDLGFAATIGLATSDWWLTHIESVASLIVACVVGFYTIREKIAAYKRHEAERKNLEK